MAVPLATEFHIHPGAGFNADELQAFQQAAAAIGDAAAQNTVDDSLPLEQQQAAIFALLPEIAEATASNTNYQLDPKNAVKSKFNGYDELGNPKWAYDTGEVTATIVAVGSQTVVAWAGFSASS